MARWALDWHFCNWWFEHVSTSKDFWAPRLSGAGSFDAIRLRACTEGQGAREQLESQVHSLGANIEAICEGAFACHIWHVTLLVIIHGICCFSKAGTQLRFSPPSPLTHESYHFHGSWCAPALKLTLRQFAIVVCLPNEPLDHLYAPFVSEDVFLFSGPWTKKLNIETCWNDWSCLVHVFDMQKQRLWSNFYWQTSHWRLLERSTRTKQEVHAPRCQKGSIW